MNQSTVRLIYISATIFLLYSCNPDNDQKPSDSYLIDYEKKTSLSVTAIRAILNNFGIEDMGDLARYDVDVYKITYYTNYLGNKIIASGVIAIPSPVDQEFPMVAAHRGTIFAHSEAPSKQPFISGYEIFSSLGFITVIPDMIGFGSSEQYLHPYYNYELTSDCALDMIKAGEEFVRKIEISYNGKLFLYGYSEGGYITTALQKAIESANDPKRTVTAVATGAGSYNPPAVMLDIASRKIFTSPSYLAFIVYTYKETYHWTEPLSHFFNSPYDQLMPSLLDGSHTSSQINAALNDTLEVLFRPAYLEEVKSGNEELLSSALEINRVDDWAPVAPMRIYHSHGDQYIPFSDSENTFQLMKSRGGNVELIEIPGDSHEEAGIEMIRVAIPWFIDQADL